MPSITTSTTTYEQVSYTPPFPTRPLQTFSLPTTLSPCNIVLPTSSLTSASTLSTIKSFRSRSSSHSPSPSSISSDSLVLISHPIILHHLITYFNSELSFDQTSSMPWSAQEIGELETLLKVVERWLKKEEKMIKTRGMVERELGEFVEKELGLRRDAGERRVLGEVVREVARVSGEVYLWEEETGGV